MKDERGRLGLNDTTGKKKPRKRSPPGLPAARRASCPIQRAQRGRQHALQVMPAESPVKQPSMAVENGPAGGSLNTAGPLSVYGPSPSRTRPQNFIYIFQKVGVSDFPLKYRHNLRVRAASWRYIYRYAFEASENERRI